MDTIDTKDAREEGSRLSQPAPLDGDELAAAIGVSAPTAKSWVTILERSGIIFILRPYYSNITNYMFTSEAFVGSSECRNQAGSIVQQAVSSGHVLTDAELDTIFTTAYNNALAAIK